MAREPVRDPVCGNHHGQRPRPREQAEHKTASDHHADAHIGLAMREPSTQDLPNVREESKLDVLVPQAAEFRPRKLIAMRVTPVAP
jgi:hypothetical protein